MMSRELLLLTEEKCDMLLKSSTKQEEKSLTLLTTDVPHEMITKKIQQGFGFLKKENKWTSAWIFRAKDYTKEKDFPEMV